MAVVEFVTDTEAYGNPAREHVNNWRRCSQSHFKCVFLPEKIV